MSTTQKQATSMVPVLFVFPQHFWHLEVPPAFGDAGNDTYGTKTLEYFMFHRAVPISQVLAV